MIGTSDLKVTPLGFNPLLGGGSIVYLFCHNVRVALGARGSFLEGSFIEFSVAKDETVPVSFEVVDPSLNHHLVVATKHGQTMFHADGSDYGTFDVFVPD